MIREIRKSPSTVPTRLATAAGLRVDETRPSFVRWKAFSRGDEADHIRFSEGAATNHPDKRPRPERDGTQTPMRVPRRRGSRKKFKKIKCEIGESDRTVFETKTEARILEGVSRVGGGRRHSFSRRGHSSHHPPITPLYRPHIRTPRRLLRIAEQIRASNVAVNADLGTAFKICSRHTASPCRCLHASRPARPRGRSRGQRLQLAISAFAKPLGDRGCHDALAVAGGGEVITLRLLLNPLQRVGLPFKSENRIDFAPAPHDAYRFFTHLKLANSHCSNIATTAAGLPTS